MGGKLGGEACRYCEYPSAVPHWERGLGLECKNSTINLFRAVAPTPMSSIFSCWEGVVCQYYLYCFLSAQTTVSGFFGGWEDNGLPDLHITV